jgi:hypothetical protein
VIDPPCSRSQKFRRDAAHQASAGALLGDDWGPYACDALPADVSGAAESGMAFPDGSLMFPLAGSEIMCRRSPAIAA